MSRSRRTPGSCKLAVVIVRALARTTVPSPNEEAAILVTA